MEQQTLSTLGVIILLGIIMITLTLAVAGFFDEDTRDVKPPTTVSLIPPVVCVKGEGCR